jgi:hypothetical protein
MRLLVVTPTLGESRWLEETVESVATLRLDVAHLLVAPKPRVRELAAKFSGCRVIAEADAEGGLYAAINAGLAATAEWDAFTYINDDDLLLPEVAAVAAAMRGGRVQLAYGGVRLIDAFGRRLGAIPISPEPALNRALYAQRLEPVYQHGTVIARAAVEAHGGFDPTLCFCGDSELLARLCVRGVASVCATRREVAAFRLRSGQLTKNRAAMIVERALVDEKLGLLTPPPGLALRRARWWFRLANLGVYAERIRRHGFVTFDELLERGG